MSPKEMMTITHRWFTKGWLGDLSDVDALFAPDLTTNGQQVGRAGPVRNVTARLTGFPDLVAVVEDQIAVDDTVVTRVRWRGTHQGMDGGVPATGQPVAVRTVAWWRFIDGKVAEIWTVQDQFGLLQHVGVLPATLWSAQVPAGPRETAAAHAPRTEGNGDHADGARR